MRLQAPEGLSVFSDILSFGHSPLDILPLLRRFKDSHESREDWEIGEEGEWIRDQEGYHAIFWCRGLRLPTVQSMVRRGKVSIRDGEFWIVENAKLMIFISEKIPDELLDEIENSRELQERAVVYDVARGLKVGRGDGVSDELERFLLEEGGITLKHLRRVGHRL